MSSTSTGGTQCRARRIDGQPCGARPGISGFSAIHDPLRAAQVAEQRRRGGYARHGRNIGPTEAVQAVKLASMADVLCILQDAANDALKLENSLTRARTIAYVAATWARVYETSELERRLAALEAAQGVSA